jgi:hypothetical protein
MNTGQFIYQLAISTTMFAEHIVMELWSWHSWPSQNVSSYNDTFQMLYLLCLAERQYDNDGEWRMFRRQIFHSSLEQILEPLREGMSTPVVLRCPDGQFRHAIYGLGPYIADYPEQCLISSVVQGWCAMYDYFNMNFS